MSCFGDAELEESDAHKYCHNKSLINKVFSSTRWYYVLTIGFLVNFFIVVFLVVYIIQWRRRHHHGRLMSVNLESPTSKSGSQMNGTARKKSWGSNGSAVNNNRGYSPVKSGTDSSSMTTVPFHDYESTSEDEELFRKPFTDHKWQHWKKNQLQSKKCCDGFYDNVQFKETLFIWRENEGIFKALRQTILGFNMDHSCSSPIYYKLCESTRIFFWENRSWICQNIYF